MDENIFLAKLQKILSQDSTMSEADRKEIQSLAKLTEKRHANLKKGIKSLQDSLDTLRLHVKYLRFDAEASNRERDELKEMYSTLCEEYNTLQYMFTEVQQQFQDYREDQQELDGQIDLSEDEDPPE